MRYDPGDGGGDGEKWTKDKALKWWLRDGRRSKGDRGFEDKAHVSGLSHPGDAPRAAVYPMGLQLWLELDVDIWKSHDHK